MTLHGPDAVPGLAELAARFVEDRLAGTSIGRTATVEQMDAVLAGAITREGLGLERAWTLLTDGVIANSLGGVQVLFDGIPAALIYAAPTQINVIVPSSVAGRLTTAISIKNGLTTIEGPSLLMRAQPGFSLSLAAEFELRRRRFAGSRHFD